MIKMQIVIVADTFPPLRTSGAVQLRDLSREFSRQGHQVTVMVSTSDLVEPWLMEKMDDVQILRLRTPRTKDVNYVRRTLNELLMPFVMWFNLKKTPLAKHKWDGVVWYSPSIFHGPFIKSLKTKSKCKGYLIIRDIFPEWAADMGLMKRGVIYKFFKLVARYQYSVADIIGVQTAGNLVYFEGQCEQNGQALEVLENWLDKPKDVRSTIRVDETSLAGRKIFVYAGNMGVAQGMDVLLDLAEKFKNKRGLGFLFVGRGSDAQRLKDAALKRNLENVLFFDEIDPDEIPDLYAQCDVGIVALDPRHKSHNIPGKFLTYMQSGLPVLANINAGNDLAALIQSEQVGQVCETNQLEELHSRANRLLMQIEQDAEMAKRCKHLFNNKFSVKQAVQKIANTLS